MLMYKKFSTTHVQLLQWLHGKQQQQTKILHLLLIKWVNFPRCFANNFCLRLKVKFFFKSIWFMLFHLTVIQLCCVDIAE